MFITLCSVFAAVLVFIPPAESFYATPGDLRILDMVLLVTLVVLWESHSLRMEMDRSASSN